MMVILLFWFVASFVGLVVMACTAFIQWHDGLPNCRAFMIAAGIFLLVNIIIGLSFGWLA